jgi:hypothetical protein
VSIPVACSKCKASYRVKETQAGKRGKCPRCGATVCVPELVVLAEAGAAVEEVIELDQIVEIAVHPTSAPVAPAAVAGAASAWPAGANPKAASAAIPAAPPVQAGPEDREAVSKEVLSSFTSKIPPVELSGGYEFAVLISTVVLCLLPLIYLAMIGGLGYLIYAMIAAARHPLVLIPVVPAVVLLVFMVKPLFHRPSSGPGERVLDRSVEPLLFAFVDRICEAVDAPKPVEIRAMCEVNASAGLRRGLRSLFSDDLVLRIGLPLIAGLSLRQFAGVLAHEFGHFTQGGAMRASYLTFRISAWFQRVVYQRDAWDDRLVQLCERIDVRISWIFWVIRFFVWLARQVLRGLMLLGFLVCHHVGRQMEFDADRFETRLGGSDNFVSTTRAIQFLGIAYGMANRALISFYKEGRLGDNMPLLTVANLAKIPPEIIAEAESALVQGKTGLFDSHPCDRERIERARAERAPGVFHSDRPASVLFSDFPGLSRAVTYDFYVEELGSQFNASLLYPVEDMIARQDANREAGKTMVRYFQGQFSMLRPLRLAAVAAETPDDPKKVAVQLKQSREKMLEYLPGYRQALDAYDKAEDQQWQADRAIMMLRLGLTFGPGYFAYPIYDLGSADSVRRDAESRKMQLQPYMEPFENTALNRIGSAISLLFAPQMAARVANSNGWQWELRRILPVLEQLNEVHDRCRRLIIARILLETMIENLDGREKDQFFISALVDHMHQTVRDLDDLRRCLWTVPYPFEHAQPGITVGQYLLKEMPHPNIPGQIHDACEEVSDSLQNLYYRIVGRAATAAEQVEMVLNLPPLPEPPPDPPRPTA